MSMEDFSSSIHKMGMQGMGDDMKLHDLSDSKGHNPHAQNALN